MKEIQYLIVDGQSVVLVTDHEARSINAWVLQDGKWESFSPAVASFEGRLVTREYLGAIPPLPDGA